MTLRTGKSRHGWRQVLISGAVVAVFVAGFGSATANADILDDVGAKYMQGAGGGQVSNFVKEALTLRAQGFKPSKTNIEELQAGWDYLPNQSRLIEALQQTVTYQRKLQAQVQNAHPTQQPGYNMGIGQPPPGMGAPADPGGNPGIFFGPSGGITQPVG